MNLDHFKDPRSFVQESVDYARSQLLQEFKIPDRKIDGVRFCVEFDECVTYGCAILNDADWDRMGGEGWLLITIVAAGNAFLTGRMAERRAARFEFERVCQQWNNVCDERSKLKSDQSRRGRQPSKKVHDRNVRWTLEAYRLVAAGKKSPHDVASLIATDKKINPDSLSARTIRNALTAHRFYE